MDDHMLDRLIEDIQQCLMVAIYEYKDDLEIKASNQWKAAKALICAYNKMIALYYLPEYSNEYKTTIGYQWKDACKRYR